MIAFSIKGVEVGEHSQGKGKKKMNLCLNLIPHILCNS